MLTTLAYSLAAGMFGVLAFSPIQIIAWRFLRLVGILVLALVCGGAVAPLAANGFPYLLRPEGLVSTGAISGLSAIAVILLAPVAVRREATFRFACLVGALGVFAAACIHAISLLPAGTTAATDRFATVSLVVLGEGLGAFFTGSITLSWLLGHAYLTATNMTLEPLRYFSRLLIGSVNLRLLFFLGSAGIASATRTAQVSPLAGLTSDNPSEPATLTVLAHLADSWLIAFLRVGVGLVAVGVFAYMVRDCIRRRATQSATGILYFASIFAYVGELAGRQLIVECGWAF